MGSAEDIALIVGRRTSLLDMVKAALHAHDMGWIHADSLRQAKAERSAELATCAVLDLETIDLHALLMLEELKGRQIALFEASRLSHVPLPSGVTIFSRPISERELRTWCRRSADLQRSACLRHAA